MSLLLLFNKAAAAAYTLTCAKGAYSLTGVAAGLTKQSKVSALVGTYTLTGNAAGLTAQRKLTAVSGSYALTGNAAGLTAQRQLTAVVGSYTLTGNAATLTKTGGYALVCASGAYGFTGTSAALTYVPVAVAPVVADSLGGTTSLGGGSFNRKKWKQLLEEIRQQLADEQTSLKIAKKQAPDQIDYAARAQRVEAIHQRALALEADAAAQSLTTAAASAARFAEHVARIEAQYQEMRALEIAFQEDEDDVLMLVLAA